jgi:thiol-disulfide isomerase/thioredoxin
MKNFKLILLLILVSCSTLEKDDIKKKAFQQAKAMTELYNNRVIPKYVDFLLPIYYGNDSTNKANYSRFWEMILKQDTAKLELLETSQINKSESQYQALYRCNFRSCTNYTIGISNDEGKTWKFTTFFNESMKFDQLLEIIPSLDRSFAEIIDKNFGKRIDYKIGEIIQPFYYIDIEGNKLSSESLKSSALVLNFWSTSCAPCLKEIPELNELVKKYNTNELKFIAPAVLTDKETLINHFLPRNDFLYDIVLVDADDYVISSYPTHIIIDKNHEVKNIITGYSEDNMQKLEKAINGIL